MMGKYQELRYALSQNPTPGPFNSVRSYSPGNQEVIIRLTCNDEYGITNYCTVRNSLGDTWKTEANAAYIAACDPDTIRELLEERDALAAENARLQQALLEECDVARPSTPVGWSDTDWIKHLQDQERLGEGA